MEMVRFGKQYKKPYSDAGGGGSPPSLDGIRYLLGARNLLVLSLLH